MVEQGEIAAGTQEAEVTNALPEDTGEALAQEGAEGVSDGGGEIPEPPAFDERARFAEKFAKLSQRESRLRKEREELRAVRENAQRFSDLEDLAKENPLQLLEKFGINYDELARRVINDGNPAIEDVVAKQQREIESLRDSIRKDAEEREARLKAQETETAYNGFIDNIKKLTDNNPKYELISSNGAHHVVYELMEEQYQRDGTVLGYEQAADLVEQYYEDEAERYYKSSKLREKYRSHWQPPEPEPAEEQQQERGKQAARKKRQAKTLTNDLTQQTPAGKPPRLSREESLERAAEILRSGTFK